MTQKFTDLIGLIDEEIADLARTDAEVGALVDESGAAMFTLEESGAVAFAAILSLCGAASVAAGEAVAHRLAKRDDRARACNATSDSLLASADALYRRISGQDD